MKMALVQTEKDIVKMVSKIIKDNGGKWAKKFADKRGNSPYRTHKWWYIFSDSESGFDYDTAVEQIREYLKNEANEYWLIPSRSTEGWRGTSHSATLIVERKDW